MELAIKYCSDIKRQLAGYFGTWMPNTQVKLGEYGTVESSVFTPRGSIESFDCQLETASGNPVHLQFISQEGVSVKFESGGNATTSIAKVEAGLRIAFSKANGVFFNAADAISKRISNIAEIETKLVKLAQSGKWQKEWVVVTGVVATGATTIAISNSARASISIRASGNVAEIDLADASLNLKIESTEDIGFQVVGQKGLVPLLHLSQLKTPLIGKTALKPRIHGAVGVDQDDGEEVSASEEGKLRLVELE